MSTFSLSITLDGAGMRSGDDVAGALAGVARQLAAEFDGLTLPEYAAGSVKDTSGHTVGSWGVAA